MSNDSTNPTLGVLLQKFLRLVDFRGQIWAPASIRMVQHHEGPVVLSNLFLRKIALTGQESQPLDSRQISK